MRITQTMIVRNTLLRMTEGRDKMHQTQERISSGKRVSKPSDNPADFARADRFRVAIKQNEQYLRNIDFSMTWSQESVSMLENLNDIALQARDIANRGADGQSNTEVRNTLAGQLEALLNEALAVVNSQYLGKSLFAGTETLTKDPFQYSGGVVSYIGNDEQIRRSYSESVSVRINVTGQSIMDTDIFSNMTDLLTALQNDDETAVRNMIDPLKTSSEELLGVTAEIGAQNYNLQLIRSRLEQTNVNLNDFLGDVESINLEEEIVRYKSEELAYQVALQSTTNIINLNIMQYFNR